MVIFFPLDINTMDNIVLAWENTSAFLILPGLNFSHVHTDPPVYDKTSICCIKHIKGCIQ